MGLDMYVVKRKLAEGQKLEDLPDVDFEAQEDDDCFFQFRKHADLHGWMEQLYRKKDGKGSSFNCDTLLLMPADIDQLEADLKEGTLPKTTGFFFGKTTEEDLADTHEMIRLAREAFAEGYAVYYDSWW